MKISYPYLSYNHTEHQRQWPMLVYGEHMGNGSGTDFQALATAADAHCGYIPLKWKSIYAVLLLTHISYFFNLIDHHCITNIRNFGYCHICRNPMMFLQGTLSFKMVA